MELNIDFCFADDKGTLAVAGWSSDTLSHLELAFADLRLKPTRITRHARQDLHSMNPWGFIALFDLTDLNWEEDAGDDPFFLQLHTFYQRLPLERLFSDAERLADISVNELFSAFLTLIAEDLLHFEQGVTSQAILSRLSAQRSNPRETADYTLALDHAKCTATGQGFVRGWHLAAQADAAPLLAFAIDNEQMCAVNLFAKSLPRPDLAAYGDRYSFTGMDGFCGSWAFKSPPKSPVRLIILQREGNVTVPVETVTAGVFAEQISTTRLHLNDVSLRDKLQAATLPRTLSVQLQPATGQGAAGETLLLLDHDLLDTDLRDVLRRVGQGITGTLRIHLLRNALTPALTTGLQGAQRELTCKLVLETTSMVLTAPKTLPERVLFARSSTLFQFDPSQVLAEGTRLVVHDPIGLVTSPENAAARFSRDHLSFALVLDGPTFFSNILALPSCFITLEAQIRLLAALLLDAQKLEIAPASIFSFYEGKAGPYSSVFPYAGDWHSYDAHSQKLLTQEVLA